MNQYTCTYDGHENQQITAFCLNLECKKQVKCCAECLLHEHEQHNTKDCKTFQKLKQIIENDLEFLAGLIAQLENTFDKVKIAKQEIWKHLVSQKNNLIELENNLQNPNYQILNMDFSILKQWNDILSELPQNQIQFFQDILEEIAKYKEAILRLNSIEDNEQAEILIFQEEDYQKIEWQDDFFKDQILSCQNQDCFYSGSFCNQCVTQKGEILFEAIMPIIENQLRAITMWLETLENAFSKSQKLNQLISEVLLAQQNNLKDIDQYLRMEDSYFTLISNCQLLKNWIFVKKFFEVDNIHQTKFFNKLQLVQLTFEIQVEEPMFCKKYEIRQINLEGFEKAKHPLIDQNHETDLIYLQEQGLSLDRIQQLKSDIEYYDLAIRQNPQYSNAYNNKGYTLEQLHHFKEAIIFYNKATTISPSFFEAYHNKGFALRKQNKFNEAIECFDQVISINSSFFQAFISQGYTLIEQCCLENTKMEYQQTKNAFPCLKQDTKLQEKADKQIEEFTIKLNRFEDAIMCFDKAINVNPYCSEAHFYKAKALRGKQWLQKAVRSIKCSQAQRRTLDEQICLEKSIQCYDQVININPNLMLAFDQKGKVLKKLNRFEDTIQCCDQAININPNYFKAYINKGKALKKLNRIEEAIQCYDQAININPNLFQAYKNKGIALAQQSRLNDAIHCFNQAIFLNPNYFKALSLKGKALMELKRFSEAIQCLDLAISINPNSFETFNKKGQALARLKYFEDAIECFDEAIKMKPTFYQAFYNKGKALDQLGRFEEAIKCYDQALNIKPNFIQGLNNKGADLYVLQRLEEAIICYDEAINKKSDYYEAFNNKGKALDDLNRIDEAIQCYDQAIEINPNFFEAFYNKGKALDDLYNFKQAINCYDKAIEIDPNYYEAFNSKGNSLFKLNCLEDSLKCYDSALNIKPDFFQALNNKGNVLYILNRFEDAVRCYDQAISIKPDFCDALNNKGNALLKLNCLNFAIQCYDQAIEKNPDFKAAIRNREIAQQIIQQRHTQQRCQIQ